MDTLAKLHLLNVEEIGLAKFGPMEAYYPRQLHSLVKVSRAQALVINASEGELPYLERMVTWFRQNMIEHQLCLVHGDYKVRVTGFLPWTFIV